VRPAQLNQSVPAAAPGARIFGAAAQMQIPLSWWDLMTWWHVAAMSWPAGGGNRAHRGPIFLPWHRMFLRRLEEAMQDAVEDEDFALPYWDWSADGELAPASQRQAPVWQLLGPTQGQVTQGPLGDLRVRLFENPADLRLYVGPPRPIWRDAGAAAAGLPDRTDTASTLVDGVYDQPSWDEDADSFRNKLEGFEDPREGGPRRTGPWMHNRVHVWIGGEMAPGSSPNDPAFWLNHCNVDRIWEAWLRRRGRSYRPQAGEGFAGHRADDPMLSVVWPTMTPAEVLDPTESGLDWYRYDTLPT